MVREFVSYKYFSAALESNKEISEKTTIAVYNVQLRWYGYVHRMLINISGPTNPTIGQTKIEKQEKETEKKL